MYRQKKVFLFFFIMLVLLTFSSAAIFIDESNLSDYNIGDEISFSFTVEEPLPVVDFVEVYMVCDDERTLVLKEFRSFVGAASQSFDVYSVALDTGDCYFDVSFRDDTKRTNEFSIDSTIDFSLSLNGKVFEPGENVEITGDVSKRNSDSFNYSLSFSIDDVLSHTYSFHNSSFNVSFVVPQDLSPGVYEISLLFEERNLLGDVINKGVTTQTFEVLAKATSLSIETLESFEPPFSLQVTTTLRDQAGEPILNKSLFLKVYNKSNALVFDEVVQSGVDFELAFPSYAARGAWRINAFYTSISAVKPFYVLNNSEIAVSFENGSSYVTITNVGNVPYQGVLSLELANGTTTMTVPLSVELGLGESKQESLGVSGSYNLSVDGKDFPNVLITGAAIFENGRINYSLIGFSLLFIIILVFLFFFIRFRIRKSPSSTNQTSSSFTKVKQGTVSFKRVTVSSSDKPKKNKDGLSDGSQKRVYVVFFKSDEISDSSALTGLLQRYGLKLFTMGDMSFTLLKSSRSPENKLLSLINEVVSKTEVRNFFFHSVVLEESSHIYGLFSEIRALFKEEHGVVISEAIYERLPSKKNFSFLKDLHSKETLIKLFSLAISK